MFKGGGCFGLHSGNDVLVGGHCETWGGVTEAFADHFDRHACLEEQRGMRVTEIMEPDLG